MDNIIVGIIGCGNMGSAIARGMLDKHILDGKSVFVFDKESEKASDLAKETGCSLGDLSQMVRGSDVLIVAVKPQDFDHLAKEIAGDLTDQTLVSVMAGVKIADIALKLGKEVSIARTMPNLAAFIAEGITGISFNEKVDKKEEVKEIFLSIGKVLEIEEVHMDGVTALSGSGPAYLFYLAQAMIEAGKDMGMDEKTAEKLVTQTLRGAALFLDDSDSSAGELIEKVASKGGTTEAALSVFEEKGMKPIIKEAILKAAERSEELSGK